MHSRGSQAGNRWLGALASRKLVSVLVSVVVAGLLAAATTGILVLVHRADRVRRAEVALADIAHLVDAVRFQPASFLHGAPARPQDLASSAATRRQLAIESNALVRLSPVGIEIRAATADLNQAVAIEVDLIAQHRLVEAQQVEATSMQGAYQRLGPDTVTSRAGGSAGLMGPADDMLSHEAARAVTSADRDIVFVVVAAGAMLVLVMLAVGVASRRRAATEAGRKAERQASARLEALVRHGSDVITVVGTSGIVVYQSPSTLAITGCRASDIEGKRFADWVHPDDQHLLVDLLSLDAGDREELRLRRGDGEWLTCEVLATSLADHPEIGGTVLNIRDMTERKQAEGALRDSEEKFRLLFQKNPHPMWVFDLETLFFMEVNQAAVERYGYSRDEFLSMRITDIRPKEDVAALRAFVASPKPALNNAGVWRHCTRRGETLDVDVTSYALEFGGKAARLVTAQDVTARIAAERALVHQAMHDRLTGLPNRLLLLDRLEQGLERAARSETEVAVIVLDLDRFKLINDGKGHAVGDQLLVEVANRLSGAVSPGDTLARLGGDEFVVVVEGITDEPQTMVVCERLAWCLDAPFVIDSCELKVSASQGIALAKPGEAAAEVLSRADAAMYLAKDRGRGRAEFADESIRAEAAGRLELESALRRAHDRGEFVIHYQPVIALATGRIVGAEALARWQHPDDGLVGPARFIAAAEASGLIVPIGGAILRQALKDAATWPIEDTAAEPLSVAVNLSALQLLVPDVAAMVASAISDSGLDAARVHLEITESVLMRDIDRSAGVLRALKELGVHIDIDDFGTGYSSLNYLQRLPIDTIKIDKSFVDRLDGPDQDHSIVHAVISMAHALRMGVVAEGVESEHQRIVLSELGCELAQGFLFARPVPLTVFEDLLRSGPFPEVGGAPSEAPVPLAVV